MSLLSANDPATWFDALDQGWQITLTLVPPALAALTALINVIVSWRQSLDNPSTAALARDQMKHSNATQRRQMDSLDKLSATLGTSLADVQSGIGRVEGMLAVLAKGKP